MSLTRRGTGLTKASVVNVSQIDTLDRRFLSKRVRGVSNAVLPRIDTGLQLVLAFNLWPRSSDPPVTDAPARIPDRVAHSSQAGTASGASFCPPAIPDCRSPQANSRATPDCRPACISVRAAAICHLALLRFETVSSAQQVQKNSHAEPCGPAPQDMKVAALSWQTTARSCSQLFPLSR